MGLVDLGGAFLWPDDHMYNTASNVNVNSATAGVAGVYQAPASGVLDKVVLRTGSTSSSATTLRVRIESVDSSGLPSGTLLAAGAETTFNIGSATTFEATLGTPVTVTRGDFFAVVVDVSAYTSTAQLIRINASNTGGVPYSCTKTTGAWSKGAEFNPCFGFRIGGVWAYHHRNLPAPAVTSNALTTANQAERGTRFTLPFPARIDGFWFSNTTAAGNPIGTLYDLSDNVLAQLAVPASLNNVSNISADLYFFPTPYDADEGFEGRIAIKSGASANIRGYDLGSVDYASATPGGTHTQRTTRTGAGSWTDTAAGRELVGLILSRLDDGAGGASGRKVKVGGVFVDA